MQEDTKPKSDDIQDEERKTPFSRSEYHGVITSYAGLALSLIAIVLSVITMYQSHMMETREIVQILRAEDDGYYHFDGETLFKNYQVTIANNSAIPVSVVEITVERDGEARTFEIADLPDILPLNMETNYTEIITVPWNINTSEENAQKIREMLLESSSQNIDDELEGQNSNSDIVLPLKTKLEPVEYPFFDDSLKSGSLESAIAEVNKDLQPINPVLWALNNEIYAYNLYDVQTVLPLSVSLCTAKNSQYVLRTEEVRVPIRYGLADMEDTLIVNTIQED